MNPDDIIRLVAAASAYDYRVTVHSDGRLDIGPCNTAGAARAKRYRDRRAQRMAEEPKQPPPPENPPPPPPVEQQLPKPRRTYGPEAGASEVMPSDAVGLRVLNAWKEWQTYRQARASHPTAAMRIAWTVQAARLSAGQVEKAASTFGPELVADRIATAITSGWQGLHFDKIQNDHNPRRHPPTRNNGSGRPDAATAAALDADLVPDGDQ